MRSKGERDIFRLVSSPPFSQIYTYTHTHAWESPEYVCNDGGIDGGESNIARIPSSDIIHQVYVYVCA